MERKNVPHPGEGEGRGIERWRFDAMNDSKTGVMPSELAEPTFPRDDQSERQRFFHHLEWALPNGWKYTTTRVAEGDHPDGWVPDPPAGWELNVDRWPQLDEKDAGWTRVGPGVLRNPREVPELVAYWRRQV